MEHPLFYTDKNISRPGQLLWILFATETEMEVIRKTHVYIHFCCHDTIEQDANARLRDELVKLFPI